MVLSSPVVPAALPLIPPMATIGILFAQLMFLTGRGAPSRQRVLGI